MEKKLRDITEVKIGFKIKSLKDSKRLSQIIAKENDIIIFFTIHIALQKSIFH